MSSLRPRIRLEPELRVKFGGNHEPSDWFRCLHRKRELIHMLRDEKCFWFFARRSWRPGANFSENIYESYRVRTESIISSKHLINAKSISEWKIPVCQAATGSWQDICWAGQDRLLSYQATTFAMDCRRYQFTVIGLSHRACKSCKGSNEVNGEREVRRAEKSADKITLGLASLCECDKHVSCPTITR